MKSLRKFTPLILTLCVVGLLGIVGFLVQGLFKENKSLPNQTSKTSSVKTTAPHLDETSHHPLQEITATKDSTARDPAHAIPNQRLLTFDDEDAYQKFLASLQRRGLTLLGRSDRLRTALVGFSLRSQLDGIDDAQLAYNYPVNIPTPPTDGSAQASALPFGQSALAFLGIEVDHSAWGTGITVAVLDTGVNGHLALSGGGELTEISIVQLPDGTEKLSHGTAVASLISGDHPALSGVAPASNILSIQVTDENGSSDSFTLAEGIIRAADAGAQIINISMGSPGDSAVVLDAVQYARERGAVIVASSGNEGAATVSYPAGYDEVIAVGAVEAQGDILDFSNTGDPVDIVAPGYEVIAAWGDDEVTSFSGTSASAPFVSGAIAAAMSENPELSGQQAANLVLANANEAGYPGLDPAYGQGVLDVGRVINANTPGIYDPAVVSQVIIPVTENSTLPQMWVTVQNQGTETLSNSTLSISSLRGEQTLSITSLPVGSIQTYRVPIALPSDGTATSITSSILNSSGDTDPQNSTRTDLFTAP